MVKTNPSIVEPIESVHETKVAPVKSTDPFDSCVNCKADLNKDLICDDCGYNLNLVYNLALETKKERERNEAK